MPTETEVKLALKTSVEEFRDKLTAQGYQPMGPRQLEADQVYDRSNGELRATQRLLRLRREGDRCTLTFKGPPAQSIHKSREEIETGIADGEAFDSIVRSLGYEIVFRYEKYRTKFKNPELPGLITFDETPIGNYMELEGPGDWIDTTAVKLGYSKSDYITASYSVLYLQYCEERGLVPSHMTF